MTGNENTFGIIGAVLAALSFLLIRSGRAFSRKYFWLTKTGTSSDRIDEHQVLLSQLEIREQTMKTISQEIHDNIGQILSLVTLHLNSIDLGNNPVASCKLNTSMELINRAMADLRDLSRSMNAENMARTGLPEAVRLNLELISRTGLITASLQLEGPEASLDTRKEIITYRIIQEALQNIVKHAAATEIRVLFNYLQGLLLITIVDNGLGFDAQLALINGNGARGSGLLNMVSRAELIGAQLNITSNPGQGAEVHLLIPIDVVILS